MNHLQATAEPDAIRMDEQPAGRGFGPDGGRDFPASDVSDPAFLAQFPVSRPYTRERLDVLLAHDLRAEVAPVHAGAAG